MEKVIKKTLVISILILFCTLFTNVYAGTAYVDNMQVECKVLENGNMDVTETITFDVAGQLNGLFRDIKINGNGNTKGASDLKVAAVEIDGQPMDFATFELYNGASGKYNLLSINNGIKVKVFTPTNDTKKVLTIDYTLYDVVTVYSDVAELYWNFIGDEWEYGMDNVDITVVLPGDAGVAGKDLRVWSHGPLNGNSKIVDGRTLKFTIADLVSNTAFDGRITFPTSLVPYAKNVTNETKLPSIIEDETRLANEANAERKYSRIIVYALSIACIVAFVLPLVIFIKWKKNIYKAKFDGEYYRELPEDYGPAIMNACISRGDLNVYKSLNMQATLMDLIRRKYIKIKEYTIEKLLKDKKDYKLTLINENLDELNEQEKTFITKLIFTEGNEMTLDHLGEINIKRRQEAYSDYMGWQKKVENVAVKKGILKDYRKTNTPKFVSAFGMVVLVMFVLMFILASSYPIIIVFELIWFFEFALISAATTKYYSMTEKGEEHRAMWKAFKKFLLDFSNMQDYDEKSLVLWEHFLVYATGLGIADKVIKNLQIKFPDMQNDTTIRDMAVLSMCSNSDDFNSFNSSFGSVASTAFSSPSSGSGGGGGSSGGGGGGRRRWRRWRFLKIKYNKL